MALRYTGSRYSLSAASRPRRAAERSPIGYRMRLSAMGKIEVAFDESELIVRLRNIEGVAARATTGPYAQPELIAAIRGFIHDKGPRTSRQ